MPEEGRHQARLLVPSIAMLIEADSFSSSSRSSGSSSTSSSSSSRHHGGGVVTGSSSIQSSSVSSSDDDVSGLLSLRAPSTTTTITIFSTTTTTTTNHGGKEQAKTRSRERNRIHARKTRQRKKALMESLTRKAEGLKQEQIRIRQCINEKNTASILCQLFSKNSSSAAPGQSQPPPQQEEQQQPVDPLIEALLRRPSEEIPDASKVPELPALILPGKHHSHSKKNEATMEVQITPAADDGIDYDLLGKDRAQCTPAELDRIRRERNRMHAKRTRDRKRLFMEEMTDVCKQLEEENAVLQAHLDGLNGITSATSSTSSNSRQAVAAVPAATAVTGFAYRPPLSPPLPATSTVSSAMSPVAKQSSGVTLDQIHTLLVAAGAFHPTSGNSAISTSSASSSDEDNIDDDDHNHPATGNASASPAKRRRLSSSSEVSNQKPAPTGFRAAPIGA